MTSRRTDNKHIVDPEVFTPRVVVATSYTHPSGGAFALLRASGGEPSIVLCSINSVISAVRILVLGNTDY